MANNKTKQYVRNEAMPGLKVTDAVPPVDVVTVALLLQEHQID